MKENEIAAAIREAFISPNVSDSNLEPANIVDTTASIARALRLLGNADASTPFGGLEALGQAIRESATTIAASLDGIAEAINNHADALNDDGLPQ